MSKTRRELITGAFGELGVSNEFDVSPEEIIGGIEKLNRMLSAWNARGLRVGYSPGAGIDEQTGIVDGSDEAVTLNLALRLAPGIGKVPSPDLKRDARLALLALLTQRVRLIPVQLPAEMIAGAGNRRHTQRVFLSPPTDPLEIGSGGTIDGLEL